MVDSAKTTSVSGPSAPPSGAESLLIVIGGPSVGEQVKLGVTPVVIGRALECDLSIDSDSVSRRHAGVYPGEGGHYFVKDLGSTNGTLVNDEPVQKSPLADGDLLKVGKAVIKFVARGNPEGRYLQQMTQLASADDLTGVANRRSFDERLGTESAKLPFGRGPLSLILVDIDHFKKVNDTHGHPGGDAVLVEVARVIGHCLQPGQLIGRVGGEEFGILCPGLDSSGAHRLAERIRAAVQAAVIAHEKRAIHVTVSAGVATLEGSDDGGAADLYGQADGRLYKAKDSGRNCVR